MYNRLYTLSGGMSSAAATISYIFLREVAVLVRLHNTHIHTSV